MSDCSAHQLSYHACNSYIYDESYIRTKTICTWEMARLVSFRREKL